MKNKIYKVAFVVTLQRPDRVEEYPWLLVTYTFVFFFLFVNVQSLCLQMYCKRAYIRSFSKAVLIFVAIKTLASTVLVSKCWWLEAKMIFFAWGNFFPQNVIREYHM